MMHFESSPSSRRRWLMQSACGFGGLALSALGSPAVADTQSPGLVPRAKRILFLFMQGGVSQVDSFDPKPELDRRDGEQMPIDDARVFANTGELGSKHRVMRSPWKFQRYGECGLEVSDLFPQIGAHADKLCLVRSMHTEGVAHGPATLFLHCGAANSIRPSFGSWVLYGLGSENQDLPGFVSLAPSIGNGGARNYGSAFLPARYQGTAVGRAGGDGSDLVMRHVRDPQSLDSHRRKWELLEQLSRAQHEQLGEDDELDAVGESQALAARMQASAPHVFDLSEETAETRKLYGLDDPRTRAYGHRCLIARRLCESGVRFVQVNYGDDSANPAWDQHSELPKHEVHARAVDQPIAALLTDLERRGLLEDTLVWWGGEFGRTPYAEKNGTGRDHNPGGFSIWLAGGGVRGGTTVGATDEFGHQAIERKVHMHDLHATLLHQLGLDHEQLTYRYAGRDFRLTDVHGRVIDELLG